MPLEKLLMRNVWTINDMKEYMRIKDIACSKTKLYHLFNFAKTELGGQMEFGPRFVKRDSVLQLFGSNVEKEMKEWEVRKFFTTLSDTKTEPNG